MIIRLVLLSGVLRVSEVAALHVTDLFIGYSRSEVVVRHGKGNKTRVVKIGKELKRDLRENSCLKAEHSELHPEAYLIRSQRLKIPVAQKSGGAGNATVRSIGCNDASRHTHATLCLKPVKIYVSLFRSSLAFSTHHQLQCMLTSSRTNGRGSEWPRAIGTALHEVAQDFPGGDMLGRRMTTVLITSLRPYSPKRPVRYGFIQNESENSQPKGQSVASFPKSVASCPQRTERCEF